jgi:hypothetical protein
MTTTFRVKVRTDEIDLGGLADMAGYITRSGGSVRRVNLNRVTGIQISEIEIPDISADRMAKRFESFGIQHDLYEKVDDVTQTTGDILDEIEKGVPMTVEISCSELLVNGQIPADLPKHPQAGVIFVSGAVIKAADGTVIASVSGSDEYGLAVNRVASYELIDSTVVLTLEQNRHQ